MKNDKKELKKPFFANFLENQLSQEDTKGVSGGATSPTLDVIDGTSPVTKPVNDQNHTLKYPSDGDDDVQSPI